MHSHRRPSSPAPWGTASAIAIPAFAALYLLVAWAWRVPHGFAAFWGTVLLNVVAFVAIRSPLGQALVQGLRP